MPPFPFAERRPGPSRRVFLSWPLADSRGRPYARGPVALLEAPAYPIVVRFRAKVVQTPSHAPWSRID